MKKKILLSTIPALMLLGSCAGAQPKVENNLFLEDTLAHEETFGGVEEAFEKAPRNTVDPYPESASPKIAIQTKNNGDDTVSIRFIAAVNIADEDLAGSTAVWNRALFAPNGDAFREPDDKPCKVAYSKLTEGTGVIEAGKDDFVGYNRFVVYSMLNIPVGEEDPETPEVEDYSKYCFRVRLTVNETPTDDYYASTVDLTNRISFPASKTGYFLSGTFNEEKNTINEDSYKRGRNTSRAYDNQATFTQPLNEEDSFLIVKNIVDGSNHENDKFKIIDSSCLSYGVDTPHIQTYFEADGVYIKTKDANNYILYLNNSNELWCSLYTTYTINLTGYSSAEEYALFVNCWGDGSTEVFQVDKNATSINIASSKTGFQFVKMPVGTTAETFDWENKLSESKAFYSNVFRPNIVTTSPQLTYSDGEFVWSYTTTDPVEITLTLNLDGDPAYVAQAYALGTYSNWGSGEWAPYEMSRVGNTSSYTINLSLAPGYYEYKFVINWTNQDKPDWDSQNPDGNRVLS